MAIGPMVPLTTAPNPMAARILAAHLGAEGIVWELRGNVDGPYPVGPVEVLVTEDDLELARALVAATSATDPADESSPQSTEEATPDVRRARRLWPLVAATLLVVAIMLGRLLIAGY